MAPDSHPEGTIGVKVPLGIKARGSLEGGWRGEQTHYAGCVSDSGDAV